MCFEHNKNIGKPWNRVKKVSLIDLEEICNFGFNLTYVKIWETVIAIVVANKIKSLSGHCLEMPQFLELTNKASSEGKTKPKGRQRPQPL